MRLHKDTLREEAEERAKHVKLGNTKRFRLASKDERGAMVKAHAAEAS